MNEHEDSDDNPYAQTSIPITSQEDAHKNLRSDSDEEVKIQTPVVENDNPYETQPVQQFQPIGFGAERANLLAEAPIEISQAAIA